MTTIRTFMTDDHRRCDEFFAEAEQAIGKKNIEAARASFGHFRTAVLAHFDSEEKTLFPTFEAKTGMTMGPTQVMRMEHQQQAGQHGEQRRRQEKAQGGRERWSVFKGKHGLPRCARLGERRLSA